MEHAPDNIAYCTAQPPQMKSPSKKGLLGKHANYLDGDALDGPSSQLSNIEVPENFALVPPQKAGKLKGSHPIIKALLRRKNDANQKTEEKTKQTRSGCVHGGQLCLLAKACEGCLMAPSVAQFTFQSQSSAKNTLLMQNAGCISPLLWFLCASSYAAE
eukprot:1143644-Pelagomonas_calceolata.AAC.6